MLINVLKSVLKGRLEKEDGKFGKWGGEKAYEKGRESQTSGREDIEAFSTRFSTVFDGKCRGKLLTSRLINNVLITIQNTNYQHWQC